MTRFTTEKVGIRGHLRIEVIEAQTGRLVQLVDKPNKIMFLAADVLVELLAQRAADPDTSCNMIYTMRMGSSDTTPDRSDSNLGVPVFSALLEDTNKLTGLRGELQFTANMGTADGNGTTFQEAGLFTKGESTGLLDAPSTSSPGPRMFARQTHPPIPKNSALTLNYSWRIALTA